MVPPVRATSSAVGGLLWLGGLSDARLSCFRARRHIASLVLSMKIGIDNVSTGPSTCRNTKGGMRHFLTDTLTWLEKVAPQNEYVLFQPPQKEPLDLPADTSVQVYQCNNSIRGRRLPQAIYEQTIYPQDVDKAGVDVFLGTSSILPLRLRIPSVVVVQALQFLYFREEYPLRYWAFFRVMVPLTLRKATRIIALSETSKQSMIKKVGISSKKIHVVHHGLSDDIISNRKGVNYEKGNLLQQRLTGGKPYILSVSSFYHYKNLPRLLEAFALLKQRYSIPHILLFIGGDGHKVTRIRLMDLAAQLGVADSVICPGVVLHTMVPAFYVNATVAAMPSLYETFGLPVLEAMSCGCPLVTSQTGAMAEVADGCAVLVDPYSVESIAQGIARVIKDPDLRRSLTVCGIRRAHAFTREEQVGRYLRVIEEAFDV